MKFQEPLNLRKTEKKTDLKIINELGITSSENTILPKSDRIEHKTRNSTDELETDTEVKSVFLSHDVNTHKADDAHKYNQEIQLSSNDGTANESKSPSLNLSSISVLEGDGVISTNDQLLKLLNIICHLWITVQLAITYLFRPKRLCYFVYFKLVL